MAQSEPDANTLFNRGVEQLQEGKYKAALDSFESVLALQPETFTPQIGRGNALRHLGLYNEALKSFDRALTINPNHPEAYKAWGLTVAMC